MKINKLFVLILGISSMFLINSKGVLAQEDCCGGHGGVIFCNAKADRLQCYDGSLSKICTCEGIINKKVIKKIDVVTVPTNIPTIEPQPTITVLPTPEARPTEIEIFIESILKFFGFEK